MFWSQPGRTLQTALLEREIGEGGLGDGEIGWGCSWDECFEPGWAGAASERNHRALPLAGCSSPSPSPALYQPRCLCSYVWTRGELIQLKTGPKKKKRGGCICIRQFPRLVCPIAAQTAVQGKGWWQVTIKPVGARLRLFSLFVVVSSARQTIALSFIPSTSPKSFQTLPFGLFWTAECKGSQQLWFSFATAGQGMIFSAPFFHFSLCQLQAYLPRAVLNTWLSAQSNSSKSYILWNFFQCWYKS